MSKDIYEALKGKIENQGKLTIQEYFDWVGPLVFLYKNELLEGAEYGELHRQVWGKHEESWSPRKVALGNTSALAK